MRRSHQACHYPLGNHSWGHGAFRFGYGALGFFHGAFSFIYGAFFHRPWNRCFSTASFRKLTAQHVPDTPKALAATLALPPNPCQKVKGSFNGWKRGSGTKHARTCMVTHGNMHGWTRASAWLDLPKCMVPLPALHGWTFNARSACQNDTPAPHRMTLLKHLGKKCSEFSSLDKSKIPDILAKV